MTEASKDLVVGFLYDDTLDSSDGVAHQVKTIGSWLSSQGHKVVYLVGETKMTSWDGSKVYSMTKNQKVIFNGNKLSIPWPVSSKKIRQVLAQENIDVLHVQVPYSPFMSMRVINRVASQTAIVGTFHIFPSGILTKWGSLLLRLFYGRSLGRFSQFISVSSVAHQFASWGFGIKSEIMPNVIDVKRLHGSGNLQRSNHPKIVFLGRLVDRKGALWLLKAFLKLHSELPNVQLTIAGDGLQRSKLEEFVKANNLSEVVSFRGYINETDKADLLASADIACFPSIYGESFGIVLVEAMAAGAGVVLGGDNPGYRTVLGEQSSMLVNPRNTNEFAERLQTLILDDALKNKLHAWQETQLNQYDVETVGPKLVEIYTSAIANKTLKRHN